MATNNAINKASDTFTATTVNATTFDTNVAAAGVTLAGTTLAADGSDANINITLTPKGSGVVSTSEISATTVTSLNEAAATTSPLTYFKKNRSGAALTTGDLTGTLKFSGYEGTNYIDSARITSTSSGTIAANRVAGDLKFYTHPDSAAADPTLRMTIASTGAITIASPDAGVGLTVSGGGLTLGAGSETITSGDLIFTAASKIYNGGSTGTYAWSHKTGTRCTFLGETAGYSIGSSNFITSTDTTAVGYQAFSNANSGIGAGNTLIGSYAGKGGYHSNFQWNTGLGAYVYANNGGTCQYNTALGAYALKQIAGGAYNVGIGYNAGGSSGTGSNTSNIWINSPGANEDFTLRIGASTGSSTPQQLNKAYIYGIYTSGGTPSGTAKVILQDSNELLYGLTNTTGALLHVAAAGTAPIWSTSPTVTDLTLTGNLNLPTSSATAGIYFNSVKVGRISSEATFWGGDAGGTYGLRTGNTGIGYKALYNITNDNSLYNTCIGGYAGYSTGNNGDTDLGCKNVFVGYRAGYSNSYNRYNVAVGYEALGQAGNYAGNNICLGYRAGYSITGSYQSNICIGHTGAAESFTLRLGTPGAATSPAEGSQNNCYIAGVYTMGAALGATAKVMLVDSNAKVGGLAGASGTVLIGGTSPSFSDSPTLTTVNATTFDTNVAAAGVTLAGTTLAADGTDANIDINITPKGSGAIKSVSAYNKAVGSTNRAMLVDDSGYIGNATSSLRFKENVQDMESQSDFLMKLRPVTFNYKHDDRKIKKFGLIAEEVAKVEPTLVSFDENGDPYTVSYHEFTAILLNEIQRLNKRIEALENKGE